MTKTKNLKKDKENDKPAGETKILNEPHCSGCKNETTLFKCEECGTSFENKCLTESHDIINKKNGIDYHCDMMHKNPCIWILFQILDCVGARSGGGFTEGAELGVAVNFCYL